ncbi:MAG: Mur ligase middle domain protein [Candidatus Saccharibacteria bacterium]|nr:Mur ligase middle domain protein [Candidatus Saccharibacteria bacterium]
MSIKQLGKAFLSRLLEAQVKQLRSKNTFKVVAVVGSVGKTTTKLAIASMLAPQVKLQHQAGNYNDRLTVPLVFFGQVEPGIYDAVAWLKILRANRRLLKKPYPYELVVLELGSDGPGQIQQFAYVQPDITVVTALTDEHMEYFKTLDAVAAEELTAVSFSKQTLINIDDSPKQYLNDQQFLSYGTQPADYQVVDRQVQATGEQTLKVKLKDASITLQTSLLGGQGAKSVLAAAAVAHLYGLTPEQITANAAQIIAVPGRMQLLRGINNSTIIDDSYNASPVAMKAALDTLYAMPAPQRIALLGNMNEMGKLSPDMHTDVGNYCDPSKLDQVITLGPDANAYLAPAAEVKGCQVAAFTSPYEAGEYIKAQLKSGAAVLVKGSQNGVFSEEAIKSLLANPTDEAKLVRQSVFWIKKKRIQFKR